MNEVEEIIETYRINRIMIRKYSSKIAESQQIKIHNSYSKEEKVQGGKIIKADTRMANRIDYANRYSIRIREMREENEAIDKALKSMATKNINDFKLFKLYYMKRKTLNDIANEFSLSNGTIRERIRRISFHFMRLVECYSMKKQR